MNNGNRETLRAAHLRKQEIESQKTQANQDEKRIRTLRNDFKEKLSEIEKQNRITNAINTTPLKCIIAYLNGENETGILRISIFDIYEQVPKRFDDWDHSRAADPTHFTGAAKKVFEKLQEMGLHPESRRFVDTDFGNRDTGYNLMAKWEEVLPDAVLKHLEEAIKKINLNTHS